MGITHDHGRGPLLIVARNLGHANTRMVERVYGKLAQAHVKEAIQAAAPSIGLRDESNVAALR